MLEVDGPLPDPKIASCEPNSRSLASTFAVNPNTSLRTGRLGLAASDDADLAGNVRNYLQNINKKVK